MSILVIAEHDNKQLNNSSLHVITAARELQQEIDLIIVGYNCSSVVDTATKISGIRSVLLADNLKYQDQLAENSSSLIHTIAQQYEYILAPATTFGKDLLPRIAAVSNVGQISDVIQIIDKSTFVRPIYAGNALATVNTTDKIKILSIRPTAFDAWNQTSSSCPVQKLDFVSEDQTAKFISRNASVKTSRPDLSAAKIVVAGGRGFQTKENFKLLEDLASTLNAAIGASRAAVDAGFVPNDYQVGQTGKVVAPDLYIAIGISGAIQHIAGMKDSKIIVAINKDPDAPIFQIADYGLVGDLFTVVPELIASLKQ